jgi:hypothetical protein
VYLFGKNNWWQLEQLLEYKSRPLVKFSNDTDAVLVFGVYSFEPQDVNAMHEAIMILFFMFFL